MCIWKGCKVEPSFFIIKIIWRPWPKMILFYALTSCTANLWPTLRLFAIASFSQLLNWLQACILKNKTTQCTPHPISGSWNSFGNELWMILFFHIIMLIGILISPSMPIQKETSSESLMLYVRSFYILYPFFTSPVIIIMKVYLFLSIYAKLDFTHLMQRDICIFEDV